MDPPHLRWTRRVGCPFTRGLGCHEGLAEARSTEGLVESGSVVPSLEGLERIARGLSRHRSTEGLVESPGWWCAPPRIPARIVEEAPRSIGRALYLLGAATSTSTIANSEEQSGPLTSRPWCEGADRWDLGCRPPWEMWRRRLT